MRNTPAIIIAGGKSSRMGKDKALLPYEKYKTMSEFQYRKLQKYFNTVYISTKENKFDFDCELILDIQEEASPLVALVSIFEQLDIESIFILSVDAPLVDKSVITKLFANYDKSCDAIIAKSPKGLQPLCAIYNRSILVDAKEALAHNRHKLTKLLDEANTRTVHFDDENLFTNLNYMHEYKKLQL